MPEYEIKEGDWFARIVKEQGYGSVWKPIYDSGDNKEFRKKCPDPNLLIPGETCNLPDKGGKKENKGTEQKHKFELKGSKHQLHVVIVRPNGEPLKNTSFSILLEPVAVDQLRVWQSGKTDGSGAIKWPITTDAEKATVEIEDQVFELNIGWLEPVDTTKGVQARLQNLNYHIEAIDGLSGSGTTVAAVKAFQANHKLKETDGVAGTKTKAKLKEVYGC